ncbi:hypothetical protein HBI13_161020 [Parastagonospora nodorum]|nr:hypothetical protein HBI10_019620 [Parastagonospora nodorum]KAH4015289.1 hypothetical protein HBI13_161020 [Parastagonospora nodorum]
MAPEPVKLDNFGTVTREDSVPSTISEIQRPRKSRFATFWKISHAQAHQDLKKRGWKGAFWTLCYLFYFGLIYTFSALATLSSPGSIITNKLTACAPDGSLYTNPAEFSFWRASGFFQVTLGSGHMAFAQAKVVDVVWDVVFGRGGQALLTFLSWKVFTQYVTTSMQVSPVTFSTFRTIFVQGEASALGAWRLVADFSRRRGLQSRLAMVFVVVTMVFILAFPVLASAMTGYSANVEPFVRGEGAEYVPFEKLRALYFVVHDGDRIGLGKGEKVMDSRFGSGYEALYTSTWTLHDCAFTKHSCSLVNDVTDYVNKYGSGGQMLASTYANLTLPPPTLNITAYSLPPKFIRSHDWKNAVRDPSKIFSHPARMAWVQDERIYNTTDIKTLGQCQPTKTYNWGFSFIQTILLIILLLIWSTGTYTMYLSSLALLHKRGRSKSNVVGEYQAIFELSNAMHLELTQHIGSEEANSISHLTESQLQKHITSSLNGGSIAFHTSSLSQEGTCRFRHLLRKESWWIGFLVLATPAAVWCGFVPYMAPAVMVLPLPVVFAMYVRTTGGSAGVLLFWPGVVLGLAQVGLMTVPLMFMGR